MPAYFVKITEQGRGIVVSNKPLVSKEITFKNGQKRLMSVQQSGLKFGFFGVENPHELGYEKGEKIPVSITDSKVLPEAENLFWCNPD